MGGCAGGGGWLAGRGFFARWPAPGGKYAHRPALPCARPSSERCQVAIYDATNSTSERREILVRWGGGARRCVGGWEGLLAACTWRSKAPLTMISPLLRPRKTARPPARAGDGAEGRGREVPVHRVHLQRPRGAAAELFEQDAVQPRLHGRRHDAGARERRGGGGRSGGWPGFPRFWSSPPVKLRGSPAPNRGTLCGGSTCIVNVLPPPPRR